MSKTLESEFAEYAFIHKSSIVLGSLLKYYNDMAESGVSIPEFMTESPEVKAKNHYYRLLGDNSKFNKIYESCWEKYKEVLP